MIVHIFIIFIISLSITFSRGDVSSGFLGPSAQPSSTGFPGRPGLPGRDGMPGYEGIKGERGDQGLPGNSNKGESGGLTGEKGENGFQGIPGLPGVCFPSECMKNAGGEKGAKGEPALHDLKGVPDLKVAKPVAPLKGEKGDSGSPGIFRLHITGLKGQKGLRGPPGQDGTPGLPGLKGDRGLRGYQSLFKGEKGDSNGVPGMKGDPGLQGLDGVPGFCSTEQSRNQNNCQTGEKGEKGDKGEPRFCTSPSDSNAQPGHQSTEISCGNSRNKRDAPSRSFDSHIFVRHSQSFGDAACPNGTAKLWNGFSLLQIEGNVPDIDHGSVGSCLDKFSAMPMRFCNSEQSCNRVYSYRSYWVSAVDSKNMQNSQLEQTNSKHVSRCAVCDAPAAILVKHSQWNSIPDCPEKWTQLWSGYSFGMGNVEFLNSLVNCLEHFTTSPIVECNQTVCHVLEDINRGWLPILEQKNQQTTVNGEFQVSRCSVCLEK